MGVNAPWVKRKNNNNNNNNVNNNINNNNIEKLSKETIYELNKGDILYLISGEEFPFTFISSSQNNYFNNKFNLKNNFENNQIKIEDENNNQKKRKNNFFGNDIQNDVKKRKFDDHLFDVSILIIIYFLFLFII